MQINPLVSVIIPTFNRSKLIGRAIRSVLAQSVLDIEIIVVDDASVDKTEDIVKSFCDVRIRYIRLQKNGGVSRARNIGANAAQGTYLAFLDSDDEWFMEMLEKQLAVLTSDSKYDAVLAGFIRYYGQSPEYISPPIAIGSPGQAIAQILSKNFVTPQVLMITRKCFSALGGFDEKLSHREDWDFGLRLIENYNVRSVCEPLAIVYETPSNLTSMTVSKLDTLELFIVKHHSIFLRYKSLLARHLWFLGHSCMLIGNTAKGRTYLKAAARTRFSLKAAVSVFLSFFGQRAYISVHRAVITVKRCAGSLLLGTKSFGKQ